jgi:hypothetical protein
VGGREEAPVVVGPGHELLVLGNGQPVIFCGEARSDVPS